MLRSSCCFHRSSKDVTCNAPFRNILRRPQSTAIFSGTVQQPDAQHDQVHTVEASTVRPLPHASWQSSNQVRRAA